MRVNLRLADGGEEIHLKISESQVVEVKPKAVPAPRPIEELASTALSSPAYKSRIRDMRLKNKKVVVMVDDKYRPTPAHKAAPILLEELEMAGVKPENVTFITGTGLHEKMSEEELADKLGDEVLSNYEVLPHDAYNHEELRFIGVSDLGTPIWVNRVVASADFKIAVGRIAPHGDCGYEGGAKMILPGVSALETVMHNHSMFKSVNAGPGTLDENPGRRDVDDVGGKVGLDFILNFIVSPQGSYVKAFAGDYLAAHRLGVEYGDSMVWGAEIGRKADITIATLSEEALSKGFPINWRALVNAIRGTRMGGTVILPVSAKEERIGYAHTHMELASLGLEELMRKAELREWNSAEDWLYIIRAVNSKMRTFYHHVIFVGAKKLGENLKKSFRSFTCVESLKEAVEMSLRKYGSKANILILNNADTTLPLEKIHSFDSYRRRFN